jgi:hypothetical protein
MTVNAITNIGIKAVFLDFDGVLNSHAYFKSDPNNEDTEEGALDPKAIVKLNKLIAATGAKVVVSSSWRYGRSVERLTELLVKRGFVGEVIGKTADCVEVKHVDEISAHEHALYVAHARGDEIQEWLNKHPEVKSFVVLDDDSDMTTVKHRLVKTSLFLGGLLDHHVEEAIKMLADKETK